MFLNTFWVILKVLNTFETYLQKVFKNIEGMEVFVSYVFILS
jgi:hypothetical protein